MSKEIKTERIGMRVSPQQKKRWEEAAKSAGFNSLAAWIGDVLESELAQK